MFLFLAPALAADCAYPLPVNAVDAALLGMEASWGVDEVAFTNGLKAAREALQCVAAPIPAPTAARFHRMEGLAAFLSRDTPRATVAFAAAKALEPAYTFPLTMIPAQNPVRVAYEGAVAGTGARPTPSPRAGIHLWIDGSTGGRVPASRATVVQVQEGDGPVTESAWLLPGDPLPPYPRAGSGLRVPLLIGAGVLAAGAGTLWALGAEARESTLEPVPLTPSDREARQDTANTLGGATIGVGAAAVLTGVSAFVFGRW